MKRIKQILAIVMVAIMALTALTFSASSESIEDTAKTITSGTQYSTKLRNTYDTADYKIVLSKSGKLTINVTSEMSYSTLTLYDSNGNYIDTGDVEPTTGSAYFKSNEICCSLYSSSIIGKCITKVTFSLDAGTYYLRFKRAWNSNGDGKITFTATFPSASTASKGKVHYLTLTLDKGDSIKIGAAVTAGSKATWSTSNSSVATIKNGKVVALSKGSAIITARCGSSSQQIKIKVV